MVSVRILVNPTTLKGVGLTDIVNTTNLAWDFSEANLPWAATSSSEWESRLPSGVPVINLSSTGSTFIEKLTNTVNSQSGRFICRLPAGRHTLTAFNPIGGSGDPLYSFGFWFPKLAGFVGPGADVCSVEMAANSMSQAQIDALNARPYDFNPIQIGLCRIDSSSGGVSLPTYLGGLTFRSADQQNITNKADAAQTFTLPTPAPHQGVVIYGSGTGTISHVRFQAAGRALMGRPPFEMGNITTQYGNYEWFNTEFDGRRALEFDTNRPARCGPWMGNNEVSSRMTNCWMHDNNQSRYAANDENRDVMGAYELTKCKIEKNPVASCAGWESSNSALKLTNCIFSQDGSFTNRQLHMDLTSVGSRSPSGGRMTINGGIWRTTPYPQLDGYLTMRIIASTSWFTEGLDTTVKAYHNNGQRLVPWTTTSWPPSAATLASAGVSPTTHYLVKTN